MEQTSNSDKPSLNVSEFYIQPQQGLEIVQIETRKGKGQWKRVISASTVTK